MKYKLLRAATVNGALHPKGEVRDFCKEDQMDGNKIMMCFGHGAYWPFVIGVDVEILPDISPAEIKPTGPTKPKGPVPQRNCLHDIVFRGVHVDENNIQTNYYYCPSCETVVIKSLAVESFINPINQERDRLLYEDAKTKHAQRLKNITPAL